MKEENIRKNKSFFDFNDDQDSDDDQEDVILENQESGGFEEKVKKTKHESFSY